jgi:hypothetical protein
MTNPPNAALIVMTGAKENAAVVTLLSPQMAGDVSTFEEKVVEGTIPREGQYPTIFIDGFGYGGGCSLFLLSGVEPGTTHLGLAALTSVFSPPLPPGRDRHAA